MSLPVSASMPDLAMTIPTGFAAALGIWFATTTAVLLTEAGLARRIAKCPLLRKWRALPVTEVRAVLRLEQQCVTTRLRTGVRPAPRQPASGSQILRTLLQIAAFAFGLGVALPTLAQTISGSALDITGQSTLQGDVVACSGHPWIDVRCNGAMADGNHDDTNAINTTISTAVANNWPVRLTAGTYKVTSRIIIDYATQAGQGFRLISDGAVIDGRTIASGPVLQIQCGSGTTSSPTACFYFREEGTLFVNGNTPAYVVVVGKTDFSDAHNSAKFDHLIVNNADTAATGGGCQFNYVLDSGALSRSASFRSGSNSILAGNTANRTRLVWGPSGAKYQAFKEAPYKDDFDEWLARIVCYAFSLPPTAFTPQVNRATAQTAQEAALEEGLAPLLGWVKRLVDGVIQTRMGQVDLEFAWSNSPPTDPTDQATILSGYVKDGIYTLNEARDILGMSPVPGGDEPMFLTAQGPVLLSDAGRENRSGLADT